MFYSRPIPVTAAVATIFGYGCYGIVTSFVHFKDPLVLAQMATIPIPIETQISVHYANWLICLLSGMFMFQDKNWARWLYIGWAFLFINYTLLYATDTGEKWILVSAYLLCGVILLLPTANKYFSSELNPDDY